MYQAILFIFVQVNVKGNKYFKGVISVNDTTFSSECDVLQFILLHMNVVLVIYVG